MEKKELQEKIFAYRLLESRLDGLIKQRDLLISRMAEIQSTLNSIDEIEKSREEILFPLGSNAYVAGKVNDKKNMIVEIGAGIALEKTTKEGEEILKRRMEEVEKVLTSVQQGIIETSSTLNELGPQIQQGIEKEQSQVG
jgi:prefoldin alpha subunit